ncbi:NLR family CARD domain-containing protein 3 CARD15-like protein [Collichthys lucidus]|uniref:NLR family CARD domain-containing protein 3 CARD15-like protein n=1 Tax=Collichthys lucidus TaxID=240159 RepID=A0A4U5V6H1_COLLU|nr:NLR family CARD domain-containing protein 3 CARD15-like protein [Collichthys lucidus]
MSLSGDSSLGEAVSGRGQSGSYEEGELFYIPERRPSLDLGPAPMDTSHWYFVEQASPPALSYCSMTSEDSATNVGNIESPSTSVQLNRADSFSSCYSLDSDDCEKRKPKVKSKEDTASQISDTPELMEDPNDSGHPSVTVEFTFKAICSTLDKLSRGEMKSFKMMLWRRYPQSFSFSPQSMDMVDLVDRLLECYSRKVCLQITITLLEALGKKKLVDHLENSCIRNEVRHDLVEILKKKYGEVTEFGEKRPFDDAFCKLLIPSTCDNGPIIEHEVLNIPKLDSNREVGKMLTTGDILSAKRMERSNMKLMLITGAAGSGKTVAVRRLVLDWIEKRGHEHVTFLFPLMFRELKQYEGAQVSLWGIVNDLYPSTKKLRHSDFRADDCKIMYIFDGLDEYTDKLDFRNTELISEHTNVSSLNVLVVNLLRERLLYRGLFIITSRPQTRRCIPWDTHYDEIDVRGFCDPEREEYFRKRFKDPAQADEVIAYINSCKTLRIMCHLPLFCTLVADEHLRLFKKEGTHGAKLTRSITYIYTKLLLTLIGEHREIRAPHQSRDKEREFLMKLGKLAFTMLEQGQFKITKSDWKEQGLDTEEAVTNTGLCMLYITKPFVLYQERVLSFIHPTMQEYLAALYAFLSFRNQGKNVFDQHLKNKVKGILKFHKAMELYKTALDRSMQHKDGRLDIFLRFLFGMTVKTNLELLRPFCSSTIKWPTAVEDAAALLKKKITENQHPERNGNLQRCLEELGVGAAEAASR